MRKAYIVNNAPTFLEPIRNGEGKLVVVAIDQFLGMPFNRNECGFMRSEVDAFEQAQNDSVAKAILNRIKFIKSQGDSRPEEEIFDTLVPNNFSSPAEYVKIASKFGEYQFAKAQALKDAELNKPDIEKSVDPATVVPANPE